jgi:transcriptional regulator with XRE-family HTH domain
VIIGAKMRGDRLRQLRERAGYSQYELAERLKTHQTQIRRWETNAVVPNSDTLTTLAKFFNVSADYLLGLTDTPRGVIKPDDLTNEEQSLIYHLRSGQLNEVMNALAAVASRRES